MKKNNRSSGIFVLVFVVILGIMFLSTALKEKVLLLDVPENAGVTVLETIDNSLVCVFQDGQVVSWGWGVVQQQKGDFKAVSDRAIIQDAEHLAAVNKEVKETLALYNLPGGEKQKDISVGWEDQDVWPRISPDKNVIALIRRNALDSKGGVLYEFLTLDIEKERTGSPVSLSIQEGTEDFVDYALANEKILYAAGSQKDTGWIAAVDLKKGAILWDTGFEDTKEFCSVMVSPDSSAIYAGNRDGVLYKLNTQTGDIINKIQLLEEGETRPITNDYSVLNLAFSPDGKYFVATINPKAYILKAESDEIIHTFSPADRLVSKIAFSPDNQFIATSDIRAGYPVKIWDTASWLNDE